MKFPFFDKSTIKKYHPSLLFKGGVQEKLGIEELYLNQKISRKKILWNFFF